MEKYQRQQFLQNINQIFQQHHVPYTRNLHLNLEFDQILCMLIMSGQYDSLDLNLCIMRDFLINNSVINHSNHLRKLKMLNNRS